MAYSKKEREEYNRRRENISKEMGLNKNEYNRLRRTSQALHRANEDSAMGSKEWRHRKDYYNAPYEEKHYKKDVGEAFKKAKTKALNKALHYYHQQDPRGTALYVSKERMKDTDYSTKGRPIY